MVSVFLAAIPANIRAARAVCIENEAHHATCVCFGTLLRIRGEEQLVIRRATLEAAVGRPLTEPEWASVTWHIIGAIAKRDHDELIFTDSADSKSMDEFWDLQIAQLVQEGKL
jgi:hypothetical protein